MRTLARFLAQTLIYDVYVLILQKRHSHFYKKAISRQQANTDFHSSILFATSSYFQDLMRLRIKLCIFKYPYISHKYAFVKFEYMYTNNCNQT